MYLYKRADSPFWWMGYTVNGKTIKISTKRSLADVSGANRVLAKAYAEAMDSEQFGVLPEITLRDAFDRTVKTVSGSTRTSYDLSRRKLLGCAPFGGVYWSLDPDMRMSSLKKSHLSQHNTERLGEEMAHNSINIETRFLRRAYMLCKDEWGFAVSGPTVLTFPMLKPFVKTRYLTDAQEDEVSAWLSRDGLEGSYLKAHDLLVFLIDTGVRLMEGITLEPRALNFRDRSIEIFRPKTGTLSRVPMTDRVQDILKRKRNQERPFLEMTRAIRLLRQGIDSVCNQNEREVATRGMATIHSLRDTFATRLLAKGMSLLAIAKMLGHSEMTMTKKYAHLEIDGVVDEARRLLER